jgi:4-aminobutyrate aminotransferase
MIPPLIVDADAIDEGLRAWSAAVAAGTAG